MRRLSLFLLVFMVVGCSGTRPSHLGGVQTALTPCPDKPNCVSSLATGEKHKIEPFKGIKGQPLTIASLKAVIDENDSATVIFHSESYLYAEYESAIMGYVDDVEFLKSATSPVIQVRSASRLGYSDLGANRDRIEAIRAKVSKKNQPLTK